MKETNYFKNFIKYVSLNIIGTIGVSCYILADTFFVSLATGANGLAALNFGISIFCLLTGLSAMIGMGGATRFAILKGQDKMEEGSKVFSISLLMGVVLALLFLLIAIFFTEPISRLLGAGEGTLEMTVTYIKTIFSFAPFFVFNAIMIAFVRNDNSPRLAMVAMLISSFSNIILDYIFMFPLDLGIFGAAFATGLSPVISLCILSYHRFKKVNSFHIVKTIVAKKSVWDICTLGFSSLVVELASSVSLITFNIIILNLEGNVGVAAYGVVANIALVVIAIYNGMAQGMQPLISRSYGEGNMTAVWKNLKYGVILALSISIVVYLISYMNADFLVNIFNDEGNEKLQRLGTTGIRLYFIGFLFAGVNLVIISFLSSISKAGLAFGISALRSLILLIPSVIIFSLLLNMEGVWLSFVVTESLACILSIISIKKVNKANL